MTQPPNNSPPEQGVPQDVLSHLPMELRMNDPAQLKALADPLRMAILRALYTENPQTKKVPGRNAKQVCELLGETRSPRIYHHIKLLLKAGLILKVHSIRRGNLVEDYFGPAARNVRLAKDLLQTATFGQDPIWMELIDSLLDATRRDLRLLDHQTPIEDMTFKHFNVLVDTSVEGGFREELNALIEKYNIRKSDKSKAQRVLMVAYPAPQKGG